MRPLSNTLGLQHSAVLPEVLRKDALNQPGLPQLVQDDHAELEMEFETM